MLAISASSVLAVMATVNDKFISVTTDYQCGWTRGTYFAGNQAHYEVRTTHGTRIAHRTKVNLWLSCAR